MIVLIIILVSCLHISQASSDVKDLSKANNDFSIKIYKSLPSTGNAFFCPASIFTALGMLYKGAGGNTSEEMKEALSYKIAKLTDQNIDKKFKDLLELITTSSNEYIVEIANAIVTSDIYAISEEYKEAVTIFYNAIIKEVNFRTGKDAALNEVNGWVSEKTHGKIPKLLDELDSDTAMVLLNAAYFSGSWVSQFDRSLTSDDLFYANGNDAKTVLMMNKESSFSFRAFTEDDFKALKLSYKGEHQSMVILLPNERNGLKHLEESLTLQKLTEVISTVGNIKRKVKVSIPKFKFEDSRKLMENLKQLGMKDAFQDGSANFTGIDKNGLIVVSDVVHKAIIEVNEKGTEAAGATGVFRHPLSRRRPAQLEFKADHPFLFFIQDDRTEMVLFMGRVSEL